MKGPRGLALTMMSGREGKSMGGKHYDMPGYRENYSEPLAYEQRVLAVAERRVTAALRNVRDWKAFRSFFNSEYCWQDVDDRRWKEMMN